MSELLETIAHNSPDLIGDIVFVTCAVTGIVMVAFLYLVFAPTKWKSAPFAKNIDARFIDHLTLTGGKKIDARELAKSRFRLTCAVALSCLISSLRLRGPNERLIDGQFGSALKLQGTRARRRC